MDKYLRRPEVRERCRRHKREWMREQRRKKEFRNQQNAKRRQIHHDNKLKVMTHYSNGKPHCACCGIEHIEFLSVDHPNGGGQKERKELGIGPGREFYAWLVKMGFPRGYRVLCYNCNSAWGFLGYCPHTFERIRLFFEKWIL